MLVIQTLVKRRDIADSRLYKIRVSGLSATWYFRTRSVAAEQVVIGTCAIGLRTSAPDFGIEVVAVRSTATAPVTDVTGS